LQTVLFVLAQVVRTCSNLRVDDCKTVNKVHYCYCNRPLCNGENAESIIEKLGDINEDDEEEDAENEKDVDSEEGSGSSDDEDFEITSNIGGSSTISIWPVSTTPTINKAVNFNSSKNLLVLSLAIVHLIIFRR
jgi:hypothetical protein